ncbi:MAG TPA: DeoR family transcriptional regulator, partial [Candidatus Brocadiia bacterium]|nr:DeoR family transcriptional regulator [Candidatus Brocadiia bacterium]
VDPQSAAVSRLMLARSRAAYLVADSSKFGRRAMCRIAPLNRLKGVVTDRALPTDQRKSLRKLGLQIITEPDERKTQ